MHAGCLGGLSTLSGGRMLAMGSPLRFRGYAGPKALPATSLALTAERFSHSWQASKAPGLTNWREPVHLERK